MNHEQRRISKCYQKRDPWETEDKSGLIKIKPFFVPV